MLTPVENEFNPKEAQKISDAPKMSDFDLADDVATDECPLNSACRIVKAYEDVYQNGESEISYMVEIHREGLPPKVLDLTAVEIMNPQWLIRHMGIIANRYTKDIIESLCFESSRILAINRFHHTGWTDEENHVYLFGNGPYGQEDESCPVYGRELQSLVIPNVPSHRAIYEFVNHMMDSAKLEIMMLLISAVMLSPFKSKLIAKGAPLEFITVLLGTSGCGKTSLAKVFCNFYTPYINKVHISSTSTTASIMELMHEFRDAPLIIDDFAPPSDPRAKRIMDSNFELITRACCDSHGKSKMGPRGIETTEAACTVFMTAEQLPTSTPSTLARLFPIRIEKNDVNFRKLSYAQKHPEFYLTTVVNYIRYASVNLDKFTTSLINEQKAHMEDFTRAYPNIHGRHRNAAAWIQASGNKFLEYLSTEISFTNQLRERYKEALDTAIEEWLQSINSVTKGNDPVDTFKRMLSIFSLQGRISFVNLEPDGRGWRFPKNSSSGTANTIGFIAGEEVWLIPDLAVQQLNVYYRSLGLSNSFSMNALGALLKERRITRTEGNKSTSKRTVKGIESVRSRFWVIDRNLLNGEFGDFLTPSTSFSQKQPNALKRIVDIHQFSSLPALPSRPTGTSPESMKAFVLSNCFMNEPDTAYATHMPPCQCHQEGSLEPDNASGLNVTDPAPACEPSTDGDESSFNAFIPSDVASNQQDSGRIKIRLDTGDEREAQEEYRLTCESLKNERISIKTT